jgi:hypothetical protein
VCRRNARSSSSCHTKGRKLDWRKSNRTAYDALVADDVVDCGVAVFDFGFGRYCQVDRRVGKTAISNSTEFIGAVADNGSVPTHEFRAFGGNVSTIGPRFRDSADWCF